MYSQENSSPAFFPQWARASVLIVALSLAGKGLGLWRELETARLFGVSTSVDAFIAASTLIFFVARMASSSFLVSVPRLIVGYREQGEQDNLCGNLFRALLLVSAGLTVIAALLLPRLVPVIFAGLGDAGQHLMVRLIGWMLPLVAGWTLIGALGGVLNAQHRYGGYQVALLVANVGVLAVLWLIGRQAGITALAGGWSVGIWVGVGVLALLLRAELPKVWKWNSWRSQWRALRALLGEANGLFIWFVLTQMPIWIDRYFAAQLAPGSLSALGYAQRLFQLPLEMVTAVVMSVWVTRVAEMPADLVARRTFALMAKLAMVTFPVAGVLALLARPIVTLIYARGAFDVRAVAVTTGPFAMYAVGLGFHTLSAVMTRTFQVRGFLRYPILVAVIDIPLTGMLDAWAISRGWEATGIAAVNFFVAAINLGILVACGYLVINKRGLSLLFSTTERHEKYEVRKEFRNG